VKETCDQNWTLLIDGALKMLDRTVRPVAHPIWLDGKERDSLAGAAGQRDSECGPPVEIFAGIDGPVMSLDDRPRDR
jgi:hypothetical protein